MTFWGMCFGGIFGGWLSDRIGRKYGLMTMIAIFSTSQFINIFTHSVYAFAFFRFMVGFGVIGMVVIAMVYMSEMMPAKTRGKYQALTIAAGTIGIPMCGILAAVIVPLTPHAWRIMFIIGSLGILLIPLGRSWLKESPRWLVSKGRLEEAEAIVSECMGYPCDLSEQLKTVSAKPVSTMEALKIMFSKGYRTSTVVLLLLAMGITVGLFYLANWGTTFLLDYGWVYSLAIMMGALSAIGTPIGDIFASIISDRGGRKTPIVICLLVGSVLTIAMALAVHSVVGYTLITFLRCVFVCGAMTIMWTYLAESFPTKIRSNVTGIIFSSARAITAAVTFTVPIIYGAYGLLGIQTANAMFFLIPAVIVLFFGKRTAQKSLEEIEAEAEAISAQQ